MHAYARLHKYDFFPFSIKFYSKGGKILGQACIVIPHKTRRTSLVSWMSLVSLLALQSSTVAPWLSPTMSMDKSTIIGNSELIGPLVPIITILFVDTH